MKFGENLKKLRKSKKLSQEDLAEKMKVSRQSVSKWETGDAYPEMNNILELCKIFHCSINELVNNNIIDVEALDEETKSKAVKLKKEQQRKMKGLSKAISVIAKVTRILVIICIPVVVASMIILGILINKVEIKENEIRLNGISDKIEITETDDKIKLKVNDKIVAGSINQQELRTMKNLLENHSKCQMIFYIETGFIFLLGSLILISILLKSLENLFTNIHQNCTPFTLENVNHIKKIAFLMIALTIIPNIAGVIFEVLLQMDLDIGFELFSLIEILFLFSIAYIFQYGYEIQLDSKGQMYEDE